MTTIYDQIGKTYTATRAADQRILEKLIDLLDLPFGSKILDVGAGTGNYSQALVDSGFHVTALEPSKVMRDQGKRHERLSWVAGAAEHIPFESDTFDGVVMTLCIHHFSDWKVALKETARVVGNGPMVILSFDPDFESGFWLFDYFPEFLEKNKECFPNVAEVETFVNIDLNRKFDTLRFPLPPDLLDHFAAAGWSRPEIYLDKRYRSGISSFSSVDQSHLQKGLLSLEHDLRSGQWDRRYGMCRDSKTLDVGYTFLRLQQENQDALLNCGGLRPSS